MNVYANHVHFVMLRPAVPEATLLKVLTDRLSRLDCVTRGWVLHGYPRTREQAEQLSGAGYSPNRCAQLIVAVVFTDIAPQVCY